MTLLNRVKLDPDPERWLLVLRVLIGVFVLVGQTDRYFGVACDVFGLQGHRH